MATWPLSAAWRKQSSRSGTLATPVSSTLTVAGSRRANASITAVLPSRAWASTSAPPLQQGFDRFELPVVDCQHQRGVSLAAPGVDMRARIQQAGHDVKMPARGGKHQQGIRASGERATLTREGNQLVQHGGAIGMSGHDLLQSLQVICLDSLAQDRQAGGG